MKNKRALKILEDKFYYWQVLESGLDRTLYIYNSAGQEIASVGNIDNDYTEKGDLNFLEILRGDYSGPNLAGQVEKLFSEEAKELLLKSNGKRKNKY